MDKPSVDTAPSCGNILAGVGPFAIENGYVAAQDGETTVRVRNVNTVAMIDCVVQTPNHQVTYEGDTSVDGVPGTSAPIRLEFRQIGRRQDRPIATHGQGRATGVCGVDVSCVDPGRCRWCWSPPKAWGRTGYESKAELDGRCGFCWDRLETIRRAAGRLMGLGDVSNSVIPKIAILAKSRGDSGISSRYFTPRPLPPRPHAATGAICVAGATRINGNDCSCPGERDR